MTGLKPFQYPDNFFFFRYLVHKIVDHGLIHYLLQEMFIKDLAVRQHILTLEDRMSNNMIKLEKNFILLVVVRSLIHHHRS